MTDTPWDKALKAAQDAVDALLKTGDEMADRLEALKAELAYYKGVHDGIHSTGTHVVVERKLLDELERAFVAIGRDNENPKRYSFHVADIVSSSLAMIREQEKADD